MSSGEVLKADKDFTKEADVQIPEAEKLGQVSFYHQQAGVKLIRCSRATHKLPLTSCSRSRRRHARYGSSSHAHVTVHSHKTGFRSCIDLSYHHRHRHNSQEGQRLEPPKRAGASALEEAWPAQTGHHQDGPDRHDLP